MLVVDTIWWITICGLVGDYGWWTTFGGLQFVDYNQWSTFCGYVWHILVCCGHCFFLTIQWVLSCALLNRHSEIVKVCRAHACGCVCAFASAVQSFLIDAIARASNSCKVAEHVWYFVVSMCARLNRTVRLEKYLIPAIAKLLPEAFSEQRIF